MHHKQNVFKVQNRTEHAEEESTFYEDKWAFSQIYEKEKSALFDTHELRIFFFSVLVLYILVT